MMGRICRNLAVFYFKVSVFHRNLIRKDTFSPIQPSFRRLTNNFRGWFSYVSYGQILKISCRPFSCIKSDLIQSRIRQHIVISSRIQLAVPILSFQKIHALQWHPRGCRRHRRMPHCRQPLRSAYERHWHSLVAGVPVFSLSG